MKAKVLKFSENPDVFFDILVKCIWLAKCDSVPSKMVVSAFKRDEIRFDLFDKCQLVHLSWQVKSSKTFYRTANGVREKERRRGGKREMARVSNVFKL